MNVIHPVVIRIPHHPGIAGPQIIARQRDFARIALEHSARLIGAPPGAWPTNPERVPLPRDGFHWSIAHKPCFAAAVVSSAPVGIDLEAITPRGRDLSPAVASPEEWTLLNRSISTATVRERRRLDKTFSPCAVDPSQKHESPSSDAPAENVDWLAFFQMWTAKEAALKSFSKGIGGLKSCRLLRVDKIGRFVLQFVGRERTVEHFPYAAHLAACTSDGFRLQWHVIEGP